MEKVRIGVIGFGNMGTGHCAYLAKGEVENAELAAICDINPARIDAAKKNYGDACAYFENYSEMLDSGKVDLIIIAVPHYFHPVMAKEALSKKIHVLSEKPIGVYTKNIVELDEYAKTTGLVYGIMFQQRTHPMHKKIKEIMDAGELGELKRIVWIVTDWYRSQSYYNSGSWRATWAGEGGGILMNQCPHNLDLWQWFFGLPEKITGFASFGKYHDIEVEDDVTAYMEYKNGATGVLITTTGEAPGTNRLEISGDKGKLIYEGGKIVFYKNQIPEREYNKTATDGFSKPKVERIEVEVEKGGDAHKKITQNVVNAILNGETLIAEGTEGIKGLSIANAVYLSEWTGNKPVSLPIDGDAFLAELEKRIKTSKSKDNSASIVLNLENSSNTR